MVFQGAEDKNYLFIEEKTYNLYLKTFSHIIISLRLWLL